MKISNISQNLNFRDVTKQKYFQIFWNRSLQNEITITEVQESEKKYIHIYIFNANYCTCYLSFLAAYLKHDIV
jgi:hypothetical protein